MTVSDCEVFHDCFTHRAHLGSKVPVDQLPPINFEDAADRPKHHEILHLLHHNVATYHKHPPTAIRTNPADRCAVAS